MTRVPPGRASGVPPLVSGLSLGYTRNMSQGTAEVKGAVLRGVLRDAKDTPGGIPALLEKMPEATRQRFFKTNILHGLWYSYEALAALLDAYERIPSNASASAARALGARMAERDFTTLLKVYALVASPLRLAGVPVKIWEQRFRNAGTSKSEPSDGRFRFTVLGFPWMHPMLCEILTGYGQAVGRRRTATFKTVHDRCVHRGHTECSWLSTW